MGTNHGDGQLRLECVSRPEIRELRLSCSFPAEQNGPMRASCQLHLPGPRGVQACGISDNSRIKGSELQIGPSLVIPLGGDSPALSCSRTLRAIQLETAERAGE
jgi:hypothetical protein